MVIQMANSYTTLDNPILPMPRKKMVVYEDELDKIKADNDNLKRSTRGARGEKYISIRPT